MNSSIQAPCNRDVVLRMLLASILASPGCLTAASLVSSSFYSGSLNSLSLTELQSSVAPLISFSNVGVQELRSGYIAQRYDAAFVNIDVVGAGLAEVPETGSVQLEAHTINQDGTFYEVTDQANWTETSPAIANLSAGLLQADVVGLDTIAPVSVTWFGKTASRDLTVLNTIADNFSTAPYNFAGDGIPDDWQLQYYPAGSTNADPMALSIDGRRENYFYYFFDLDPTQLNTSGAAASVVVEHNNQRYLGLEINRRKDLPTSLSFAVRFGDDVPVANGVANGVLVYNTDNPDGTVTEVWRDATPISATRFGLVDVAFNNL
ncbi:hypothetical protein [Rubellicoccus peritrichatus]|uniref:Uncharacterized protein n=1 Tax=Rubellicoccus peritrichatus TaxID=3080537 RepID=A0AAQ3LEF1_9BACT|nr:hypothetical protein [Puniceicoccus sp. CR14]WOO43177.1 hypothetical protein RZN69_08730 [Puniceicoccus sp. CR14]